MDISDRVINRPDEATVRRASTDQTLTTLLSEHEFFKNETHTIRDFEPEDSDCLRSSLFDQAPSLLQLGQPTEVTRTRNNNHFVESSIMDDSYFLTSSEIKVKRSNLQAIQTYRETLKNRPLGFMLDQTPGLHCLPKCDLNQMGDNQSVVEIANQCFRNMLHCEADHTASVRCLSNPCQTEVTDRMRVVLIAWLVNVHLRFGLESETLFLAVNLIDRYTERS